MNSTQDPQSQTTSASGPTSEATALGDPADAVASKHAHTSSQARLHKRCSRRSGRSSRMKRIVVMTGLLSLVAATAIAWGAHRRQMTPEKVDRFTAWLVDDVLDDLEADKRQRSDVHAIRTDLVKAGLSLRTGHKKTAQQALKLWRQPRVDPSAMHKLVDDRAAVMTQFAHKVADGFVRLHGILSPDQRDTLADRAAKRMAARRK